MSWGVSLLGIVLLLGAQKSTKQIPIQRASWEVLPAYSHLYVLEKESAGKNIWKFFVQSLNEDSAGKTYWLELDLKKSPAKMYTNNLRFLLARPTQNPKEAHYLVLVRKHKALVDNHYYKVRHRGNQVSYQHKFLSMDETVPVMRHNLPTHKLREPTEACPETPLRANGQACLRREAKKLPEMLWREIEKAAAPYKEVEPAMLASIVELETSFDPLLENGAERDICLKSEKDCTDYRWGRGLGQFGKSEEDHLEFVWEDKKFEKDLRQRLRGCRKGDYQFTLNDHCVGILLKTCRKYPGKRQPIFCIEPALRATAKKLAETLHHDQIIWSEKNGKVEAVDIGSIYQSRPLKRLRLRGGTYNRGARTMASWENFYNLMGRHPANYGELWAVPRVEGRTPTMAIGYSILRGEYINRCYVWRLAGICGPLPEYSVLAQYRKQYQSIRR